MCASAYALSCAFKPKEDSALGLDVKAGLGMRDLKAWTILETIAKNDSPGVNNLVCAPLLFSQELKWLSR